MNSWSKVLSQISSPPRIWGHSRPVVVAALARRDPTLEPPLPSDPSDAWLAEAAAAGVQIVKLQEAASMFMPGVTQKTVDALQAFAKTIYLSQTCQHKDGKTTWFMNLEDAFDKIRADHGCALILEAHPAKAPVTGAKARKQPETDDPRPIVGCARDDE